MFASRGEQSRPPPEAGCMQAKGVRLRGVASGASTECESRRAIGSEKEADTTIRRAALGERSGKAATDAGVARTLAVYDATIKCTLRPLAAVVDLGRTSTDPIKTAN